MPRSHMPTYHCVRHVQNLSFMLLLGCHATDAKIVGDSQHTLPQTTHTADAPMLAGSAGAAAPTEPDAADSAASRSTGGAAGAPAATPSRPTSSAAGAPVAAPSRSTGGAAGAPVAAPSAEQTSPGKVELRCADGVPRQLPDGYALVASDVSEHTWTINDGALSWLDTSDAAGWTLWRKPLTGENAIGTRARGSADVPNRISQVDTIASDGGEVFLRASELVGPTERRVVVRQVPGQALAEAPGTGLGTIAVDPDAVYWLAATDERINVYRTPRTAADTRSLGSAPFPWARGAQTQAQVTGLVAIGDYVYAALSSSGRGQVYRAAKGGNEPLAPLGAELAAVAGLTTDGTELLLVLEPERDDLGNAREPARIVRMTDAGELHEITAIAAAGGFAGIYVAVSGGLVYWLENLQGERWFGILWSAPLDGSRAPTKELTTPESYLSAGLVAADGAVYFALYCRVDHGNEVSGRTHVMQLQP